MWAAQGKIFNLARLIVKQVVAIVKPYLAEKLVEALKRAPVEAFTVREVKGYGRQKDHLQDYGETEYSLAFLPKVYIEAWVDDARVEEIVQRLTQLARTGRLGDGKIFVLPVARFEQAIDLAPTETEPPAKRKGTKRVS